tara:strand:+ start:188 stop:508 length:321 start_codon:yes stop_codon:yes gene_type:complete
MKKDRPKIVDQKTWSLMVEKAEKLQTSLGLFECAAPGCSSSETIALMQIEIGLLLAVTAPTKEDKMQQLDKIAQLKKGVSEAQFVAIQDKVCDAFDKAVSEAASLP